MISIDDPILVTGAAGFIGVATVKNLLDRGHRNIRCLVRPTSDIGRLAGGLSGLSKGQRPEIFKGDLLSKHDCREVAKGVTVIYHLAAGTGLKSFSDAYLNSVVTTRNLLDAALEWGRLKRFVNISSFAVYTNKRKPQRGILDESCPVEEHPESRAEAYCFAKVKQDELVAEYGHTKNVPFVIMRPGNVFGPGKISIPGRIGIDSFGIYLNFGGANPVPLTFVDNCAEAIALAGLMPGIEGEVFNVVDDNLPSARHYLFLYKKNVRSFRSIYVPHLLSYLFCFTWEKYSKWSKGQLPPVFTRREWMATWKKTRYSNHKLKIRLGWTPKVPMDEALRRLFDAARGS